MGVRYRDGVSEALGAWEGWEAAATHLDGVGAALGGVAVGLRARELIGEFDELLEEDLLARLRDEGEGGGKGDGGE